MGEEKRKLMASVRKRIINLKYWGSDFSGLSFPIWLIILMNFVRRTQRHGKAVRMLGILNIAVAVSSQNVGNYPPNHTASQPIGLTRGDSQALCLIWLLIISPRERSDQFNGTT
jgi:hypothetical protein